MKQIAPDKWRHFFVGIPLGIVVLWTCLYFVTATVLVNVVISFVVLFIGCYAFELYSLVTGKGHYEMADVWAGVAGGAVGIGIVLLLTLL